MIQLYNGDIIDPKTIIGILVLKNVKKGESIGDGKRIKPRVIVHWGKGHVSICPFDTLREAKDYQRCLHEQLKRRLPARWSE